MKKGFITLATGKKYRKIARNLLRSYRRFAKERLPFAILTDTEDQYTDEFDKVILITDPLFSYMDKLKIESLTPFDETIFIDSDCLIYRDINCYFNWFEKNGSDFSVIGAVHPPEWMDGYFQIEKIKKYVSVVPTFIPSFNGGIYYIKSGEVSKSVFTDANDFARHYQVFDFYMPSGDEPVLALSMAIHDCYPMTSHPEGNTFVLAQKEYRTDPFCGKVEFESIYGYKTTDGYLVHWGNYNTILPAYLYDTWVINNNIYKQNFLQI